MRSRILCGLLLALGGAQACESPFAPSSRFVDLRVTYAFVLPSGPPRDPLDAGSCAHHNAPNNLRVRASWSDESVMLEQGTDGVYRAALRARRGGEYWITFADIRLCQIDSPPVPASGVSLNDMSLVRTRLSDGQFVFRFSVDTEGTVRP